MSREKRDRISHRPYHALRHRDLRRLWAAQIVSLTGSHMQIVAINWHVYVLTRSPLALGLVGLTRALPIVLFSLWGGVAADRHDRRRVMLVAQCAMALVALGLGALALSGTPEVWPILALNALSATATAFDNPARNALIPRLVPRDELPGALSLVLTGFHAASILGPALAGLLIAGQRADTQAGLTGLGWVYALNAVSFLGVLVTLFRLDRDAGSVVEGGGRGEPALRSLVAGLRFVFTTRLMVWTTTLDFFATFFAGALSLLPIFADRILGVGPAGYGLLATAPAVGALAGSLWTSLRPLPSRQGPLLLGAIAAYGASTVVFGLSRSYALTFVALLAGGLADLVSTVIRQTLRQLVTPDALRGRMTSINAIFFMGGPQLGEMEAGLVASLFGSVALGAVVSVVSGGLATLALAGIVALRAPFLRNYDASAPVD